MRDAEVRGAEWFVPASLAAEVRREALSALDEVRRNRPLNTGPHSAHERAARKSAPAARYPSERLTAEENVTNRLVEAFYRDHGCGRSNGAGPRADDRRASVMRSAYCIRREIGECLRERPRLRGDLYLVHGAHRYRLEFDCAACENVTN